MIKKQQTETGMETPSELINKLATFYNENPDYQTSVVNISVLMHLAAHEMAKFIRRPHTQVTKIYFDDEAPTSSIIK